MRECMFVGMVSVCLLVHCVQAKTLNLENKAFTLLSEKRILVGKDVRINGVVGAVSEVRLGKGAMVDSDVYSDGQFKAAAQSSITGRLVAKNNIKINSHVTVGRVDGNSDVQIGKKVVINGDLSVGGRLRLHREATTLGKISANNDLWAAASLPSPGATSFLPSKKLNSVSVGKGVSDTLTPGNYATMNLKKKATLVLTAGTYFFNQIKLGSSSTLISDTTDGPVLINVDKKMTSGSNTVIKNKGTGQNTITTFGKTQIGSGNNLFVNIIAHGQLKIGNQSHLTGFYFSQDDLKLGAGVTVDSSETVPEPATALLLILGATSLIHRHRRQHRLYAVPCKN